jgi:hypothetical protein
MPIINVVLRTMPVIAALTWCVSAGLARADSQIGRLEISVLDKQSGEPVPGRIHLRDAQGTPQKAKMLPFWRDHFACPGNVTLDLPAGEYSYEIERGPEFSRAAGTATVMHEQRTAVTIELTCLADLPTEGWWPGDLHIHRSIDDIELLMRAEDLHVAPVITWWNNKNLWADQTLPAQPLVQFDRTRYYHVLAGEDEREGGALLYFNLPRPLLLAGSQREYPSPVKFLREARRQRNVSIDIEKPFWWDVPIWLATEQVDSIGLANNHMCRSQMSEKEAWGKPRDERRLPPPRGNGFWSQEIYYHILNCGLRIPPSAGSASGVLPNPVGYNRVYVHTGPDFSYEQWWHNLKAGRSFVTNGPLLRVEASSQLPGHVFTSPAGEELEIALTARLTTRDAISFVEIIRNGQVERKVPAAEVLKTGSLGSIRFDASGWFLVRAIVDVPETFRFASTAPYYVEIGPKPRRISKRSAQFFLDWVHERMERIHLDDAHQRYEVLQYHRAAEEFWRDKVAAADAE